jgi:hypothetical protein
MVRTNDERFTVPLYYVPLGCVSSPLEHYGVPADEKVADTTWLAEVGQRGWVALMKDESIRRNKAECTAVKQYAVRCFCLTRQSLTAQEMTSRFLHNLSAMERACSQPGPFIYAVYENRILELPL